MNEQANWNWNEALRDVLGLFSNNPSEHLQYEIQLAQARAQAQSPGINPWLIGGIGAGIVALVWAMNN